MQRHIEGISSMSTRHMVMPYEQRTRECSPDIAIRGSGILSTRPAARICVLGYDLKVFLKEPEIPFS
jgi:hypothetical protein